MKSTKTLENRLNKIKGDLLNIGDLHPGSLSKQYNVCSNKACQCHDLINPKKHGPRYQLSYVLNGRSSSRFIRDEFISETKKQVQNYKKFKNLINDWKVVATELSRRKVGIEK